MPDKQAPSFGIFDLIIFLGLFRSILQNRILLNRPFFLDLSIQMNSPQGKVKSQA